MHVQLNERYNNDKNDYTKAFDVTISNAFKAYIHVSNKQIHAQW